MIHPACRQLKPGFRVDHMHLPEQSAIGEFTTNEVDDPELGVLTLHLLQICLGHVNTLFIQEVTGVGVQDCGGKGDDDSQNSLLI